MFSGIISPVMSPFLMQGWNAFNYRITPYSFPTRTKKKKWMGKVLFCFVATLQ
jgi:hypothetical protein